MRKLLLFTTITILISCKQAAPKKNIIAKVNNIDISREVVDNLIDQELYQILQRVYVLRKTATDEIIYQKLIEQEAKKRGVSRDQFINEEITQKIIDENIEQYIKTQRLEERGIPNINNGYRMVTVRSTEGERLVIEEYKKYLTAQLYEQLKKKYPVEVYLEAPEPPKVFITQAPILRFYGNLNSKVKFIEISDMECENCRHNYPIYDSLYKKYADKIQFGFTHFSGAVTLGATMTEAAARQNKFKEMMEAIFTNPPLRPYDTVGYIKLAERIGLDKIRLQQDITNPEIYKSIKDNIEYLRAKHIYGTPTIIVNGTVIMDVANQKILEDSIEKGLNNEE